MRVIKPVRIREYAAKFSDARASLEIWLLATRRMKWSHLANIRQTFKSADEVKVTSGRPVVVFNIARNRYRLITAIHYDRQKVFVLRLLTHAEYSRDSWKRLL